MKTDSQTVKIKLGEHGTIKKLKFTFSLESGDENLGFETVRYTNINNDNYNVECYHSDEHGNYLGESELTNKTHSVSFEKLMNNLIGLRNKANKMRALKVEYSTGAREDLNGDQAKYVLSKIIEKVYLSHHSTEMSLDLASLLLEVNKRPTHEPLPTITLASYKRLPPNIDNEKQSPI